MGRQWEDYTMMTNEIKHSEHLENWEVKFNVGTSLTHLCPYFFNFYSYKEDFEVRGKLLK